jgi:predicted NAD/FAD-binding protein
MRATGQPAGRTAAIAALQAALAAEQAASYGYGVVGAHLSGPGFKVASADCILHERARDNLVKMITSLGATPQPAAVAYGLPSSVRTAADAAGLAADLEFSVVSGYLSLVAVTDPALRRLAAKTMQAAAVRAARWGAPARAFPGLADPK